MWDNLFKYLNSAGLHFLLCALWDLYLCTFIIHAQRAYYLHTFKREWVFTCRTNCFRGINWYRGILQRYSEALASLKCSTVQQQWLTRSCFTHIALGFHIGFYSLWFSHWSMTRVVALHRKWLFLKYYRQYLLLIKTINYKMIMGRG